MQNANKISEKFGFYSSIILAILTVITFGFAMIAVPPSGPYCPENCMEYPFHGLLNYYPRDYFWMYIAVFQLLAFLIFTIAVHYNTVTEKKIFSFISVALAMMSATVLLIDYFIQFAVVPVSMMKNETDGIALITQYNGHGIFIAMEELGYILMSISMFFLAFAFSPAVRSEKVIRLLLFLPLILNIMAFGIYSLMFGIDRSYRFEVAAITIDWLFIIAVSIMISRIYFRKRYSSDKIY